MNIAGKVADGQPSGRAGYRKNLYRLRYSPADPGKDRAIVKNTNQYDRQEIEKSFLSIQSKEPSIRAECFVTDSKTESPWQIAGCRKENRRAFLSALELLGYGLSSWIEFICKHFKESPSITTAQVHKKGGAIETLNCLTLDNIGTLSAQAIYKISEKNKSQKTIQDNPQRNKGGRPRKWEKLWLIIQEQDKKTPKPKDARIANIYNQKNPGGPKADAKTVALVRERYSK